MTDLTLVSHVLCPYVQRAAIALAEKSVPFRREWIDLSDKPAWFTDLSPRGKVPLLIVGRDGRRTVLFESAAILEYLDETETPRLHPEDPIERARHRGWIEFGSGMLNQIGTLYSAKDAETFERARTDLDSLLTRLEADWRGGPWFAGARFSLVDTVFGPVFRYFDGFETVGLPSFFTDKPHLRAWRAQLAARPSVRNATVPDYPDRLIAFFRARNSVLSQQVAA